MQASLDDIHDQSNKPALKIILNDWTPERVVNASETPTTSAPLTVAPAASEITAAVPEVAHNLTTTSNDAEPGKTSTLRTRIEHTDRDGDVVSFSLEGNTLIKRVNGMKQVGGGDRIDRTGIVKELRYRQGHPADIRDQSGWGSDDYSLENVRNLKAMADSVKVPNNLVLPSHFLVTDGSKNGHGFYETFTATNAENRKIHPLTIVRDGAEASLELRGNDWARVVNAPGVNKKTSRSDSDAAVVRHIDAAIEKGESLLQAGSASQCVDVY